MAHSIYTSIYEPIINEMRYHSPELQISSMGM